MSRHKVQKSSFGNNATPKKSSSLNQVSSWTNPYEQRNDQSSEQPTNTVKPPTSEEWLKNNIMLKAIETRKAQLQQQAIQAKLTVGEPGDEYEQEADMMASRVMSMPETAVQRQITPEQEIQTKPLANAITPLVQRAARPEMGGTSQANSNIESRLNSTKGGGRPLPNNVRSFMEPRFGADFSQVRVHTGSEAVQMSRELGAQAFTHGSDVYFGEGKSPGNNELTAHELTHVVQQSPVSTSIQNSGYSSPALQMRSHLRTSPLSNPVIQRAVKTSGGEWDTDQYDLRIDKVPDGTTYPPNLGIRGVDIKLKFTPGNNVDAELIGLTQSVQAFVNNAPNLTPAAVTRAIPAADAININTGKGETDEGTAIDRALVFNNPIYAVQSSPSKSLDDTNTSAGWGQNGWHYKDSSGTLKHQDATLIDMPTRPNAAKDSRHIFETTALATKGVQAGTYYGSVRWGWRTDDQGNFSKISLSKVSDGVPSSTFMKSAEIWNASKTSTGADTVDLPLIDVKVTTATVTLMPASPLQNISLPVGTRVQIIEELHPPLLNGKIKVIDGSHTGITGDVSYPEWGNIANERR